MHQSHQSQRPVNKQTFFVGRELTIALTISLSIFMLLLSGGLTAIASDGTKTKKSEFKSKPEAHVVDSAQALQSPPLTEWPDSSLQSLVELKLHPTKHSFSIAALKLIKANVDTSFIFGLINHPNIKYDTKYMKINVTGYLKKPDYSSHYNAYAVKKALAFHNKQDSVLQLVEDRYGVGSEAINSVAWVETRHGGYLGNHNVPSVYLCLAMTDHPQYVKINMQALHDSFDGDSTELLKLENKIRARSKKKSAWAVEQLQALETIDRQGHLEVAELKGSWAGAFGISQFIPSSYVSWAVDGNGDGIVNLYHMEDALFSIGNYLKEHGWDASSAGERKAVYGYNHSQAYVDAVLLLRDKIRARVDGETGSAE